MLLATFITVASMIFMYNAEIQTDEDISCSLEDQALPLILISIDGFRYDYLERREAVPNLLKLARRGIYGPMKPQFPSYTIPNHYSLVTGLYPESHGIVSNSFYDSDLDDCFTHKNDKAFKNPKWWLGEPIWSAVQRFGMKSATMFWPGSDCEILGARPNYYVKYDAKISTEARVDQVLKWLDLPKPERPNFLSLYFTLVDDAGHRFGPDSNEVNSALRKIDSGIERLIVGLKERGIEDSVNLLIVSDHGMVEIPNDERNYIYLDELIPKMKDRVQWADYGPVASVFPLEGEEDGIYSELKEAQLRGHPFAVYRKEELPPCFHYQNSSRIAPIILIAKKGSIITFKSSKHDSRGAHGFDPRIPEMQAVIIATGPEFREVKSANRTIKGVTNLDVYPLMAHLLNITPAPNNGTMILVDMIE